MGRILNLPSKLQEIGRIRAGKKTGNARTPMEALDEWRFTSPNEDAIRAVAHLYGGIPQPWADRTGEWEVYSESKLLAVQLPADAIFTAYEKWGQGGNQRRCDGERCVVPVQDPEGGHLDEIPCWCEEHGKEPGESRDACVVTVRLKVVMPDVPGLGVWMLTSSSVYAAMELPAVCDLIDALRQRSGILIPCHLELQYREEKRSYEKFTRKYHVPTLHVDDSVMEITAAIQTIESRMSIAPARPGELRSGTATGGPSNGGGLPPGRTGPPQGSGGPSAPKPFEQRTKAQLQILCREHDLNPDQEPAELIADLRAAGVSEG